MKEYEQENITKHDSFYMKVSAISDLSDGIIDIGSKYCPVGEVTPEALLTDDFIRWAEAFWEYDYFGKNDTVKIRHSVYDNEELSQLPSNALFKIVSTDEEKATAELRRLKAEDSDPTITVSVFQLELMQPA